MASSAATPPMTAGSVGITPYNIREASTRVTPSAPNTPNVAPQRREAHRVPHDHPDDFAAAGSRRHADAELVGALAHRVRHHAIDAIDANAGNRERGDPAAGAVLGAVANKRGDPCAGHVHSPDWCAPPPRDGPRGRDQLPHPPFRRHPHEAPDDRLGDRRRLLRPLLGDRLLLHEERRREPRRVFPLRAQRPLVARRRFHGRHHLRRGHTPCRNGARRRKRRGRELVVVEHAHERNAHRLLLRPALAAGAGDDGRGVRRDPLQRQAGRRAPRLPRALSRDPDESHRARLGHESDDQDPHYLARTPSYPRW